MSRYACSFRKLCSTAAVGLLVCVSSGYSQGSNFGTVGFTWMHNTEPDLAGYRLHLGTQSRIYPTSFDVGFTNAFRLEGLGSGVTYFFALTAYNTAGVESDYSRELIFEVPNNAPPTLDPIANVILSEDGGTQVFLTGISSGSPGEQQALRIAATSNNPYLLADPIVDYNGSNSVGTLALQTLPDAFGTAVVTVTVDDGQVVNSSVSRMFVVTVVGVNDRPQISAIPAQTVKEDTASEPIPFSVADSETPAEALVVTVSSSNPSLISAEEIALTRSRRTVTLRPLPDQFGTATVTLRVQDATGGTAESSFPLTVTPVNDAPSFAAMGDSIVEEGSSTALVITNVHSGASNESQALSFSAASSDPALVSAEVASSGESAEATLILEAAAGQIGTAMITVTLNDGEAQNGSYSQTFSAMVQPVNTMPFISSIGDQVTGKNRVSSPIMFNVGDQETPAGDLHVTASSSNPAVLPPSGLIVTGAGNNRILIIDPTNGRDGVSVVTITVSDGFSQSSVSFLVTVDQSG